VRYILRFSCLDCSCIRWLHHVNKEHTDISSPFLSDVTYSVSRIGWVTVFVSTGPSLLTVQFCRGGLISQ
jgi:hypothetical protein